MLDLFHPVVRAETRFQRRIIRKNGRWVASVLVGVLVGAAAVRLLRPLVAANPGWFTIPLDDILSIWDAMINVAHFALIFMIGAHYFLALSQGLQGGTLTIVREKQAKTWENLLLTGIGARDLIRGKWIGTLYAVWRAHRRLLTPRALALVYLIIVTALTDRLPDNAAMLFLAIALLTLLGTLLLPALTISFTTALGILASLIGRSDTSARVIAAVLQFASVVMVAVIAVAILRLNSGIGGGSAFILIPVLFASFDGGLTMMMTLPTDLSFGERLPIYMIALLFQIVLVRLATALVLRLAERIAIAQNVSRSPERFST
jgi:hypothetical protein